MNAPAPNNFRDFNFVNGGLQQQSRAVCVHVFVFLFSRSPVDSRNSQKQSPAKICMHTVCVYLTDTLTFQPSCGGVPPCQSQELTYSKTPPLRPDTGEVTGLLDLLDLFHLPHQQLTLCEEQTQQKYTLRTYVRIHTYVCAGNPYG